MVSEAIIQGKASTSCQALTSTPNASVCRSCTCALPSPDVSFVERSTSAPILVSDASIADLQHHLKKCSSKSSLRLRNESASANTSCKNSPRTSILCKDQPVGPSVPVQIPERADKSACVKELYFNEGAKSGASSPRGHCIQYRRRREAKPACSLTMTKIEKELVNRSCGMITKDSATCSLVDSASGTCDASARAHYYHNKLLSTLQILQNKEETIRVQAESLAVAEGRIAALSERATELRRDLDRKTKEFLALRKVIESCKVEKSDVCILTDKQMEDQSDIVSTLQNNLSVIEDLYRECFYETAKQESLIDMLRSSYLDVRLMDRQKADQIGRLQTVINTQKWSLDRCQDIALEVDSLKMEISNFLHSSTSTNNDSGMWERSEESFATAPGVQEDLQDVMEQLLRLRDLLTSTCSCGLQEENMRLKEENESLEIKIGELHGNICELECTLVSKNSSEQRYKNEIETKEKELLCLRNQVITLEETSRDQSTTCDALTVQLRVVQASLDDKITELARAQQQSETQANTIKELRDELDKADLLLKENCKIRSEVSYLTTQVSLWRAQLSESECRVRALEAELQRARAHCSHIEACYREKASSVAELQAQLEEAHTRGAALCGEARRAVCAVRHWVRRMRDRHREQNCMIKEKEALLNALQQRLEEKQTESQRTTSMSENTPSCSKCLSSIDERSRCSCPKPGERRVQCCEPSTSEMASCSSVPVPPMRLLRKKSCGNKRCKSWMCDATMQEPVRRDACSDVSAPSDTSGPYCARRHLRHVRVRLERAPRDVSPTEELFLRVEQLSEALADGHRRWTRPHDAR